MAMTKLIKLSSVLLFVLFVSVSLSALIAKAQLGIIGSLLGLIRVQGTLFCSVNGTVSGINASATPVFPNAVIAMKCGSSGNIVSSATTNNMGVFSMILDPLQFLLSSILSDCNLFVQTPLSTCNANLPSVGNLLSPLKFVGNTIQGILNIANLVPAGFGFQPL